VRREYHNILTWFLKTFQLVFSLIIQFSHFGFAQARLDRSLLFTQVKDIVMSHSNPIAHFFNVNEQIVSFQGL